MIDDQRANAEQKADLQNRLAKLDKTLHRKDALQAGDRVDPVALEIHRLAAKFSPPTAACVRMMTTIIGTPTTSVARMTSQKA